VLTSSSDRPALHTGHTCSHASGNTCSHLLHGGAGGDLSWLHSRRGAVTSSIFDPYPLFLFCGCLLGVARGREKAACPQTHLYIHGQQ
jgi:hypothetical protein